MNTRKVLAVVAAPALFSCALCLFLGGLQLFLVFATEMFSTPDIRALPSFVRVFLAVFSLCTVVPSAYVPVWAMFALFDRAGIKL